MPLSGKDVCDEVAFRVSNRLAANGTGPGSIINFTNDALGLITSAASWEWDETLAALTVPAVNTGIVSTLTGMDLGKKISVFNIPSGSPVVKVTQDEYASSYTGYVGVDSAGSYNSFRTFSDSATTTPSLQLFPGLNPAHLVDVYYHKTAPVLVYGAAPTVRWTIPAMDMLLKDWATAITKQWLQMSGWDVLWADCMGRIKEYRRMYTTERENTGPQDEAASESQEENTVGRQ